ncbi:hypothetical protein L227DRAFT_65970 [Lentinus tigrinus ALCF2SS1-6]|uniref:Uncharacterized protein n=1 Tax=Lentinus tigrinus ALCF2SS1-6 TaxID=1328759 RepID=A0A5C2SCD5_9APHY|nr:hypothetical protein L227DRAFT_65970 [Lentinus tigrinus ALCF2SS1-6]
MLASIKKGDHLNNARLSVQDKRCEIVPRACQVRLHAETSLNYTGRRLQNTRTLGSTVAMRGTEVCSLRTTYVTLHSSSYCTPLTRELIALQLMLRTMQLTARGAAAETLEKPPALLVARPQMPCATISSRSPWVCNTGDAATTSPREGELRGFRWRAGETARAKRNSPVNLSRAVLNAQSIVARTSGWIITIAKK